MQDLRIHKNYSFGIIVVTTIIFFITFIAQVVFGRSLNVYMALHPVLLFEYKHFWAPLSYMFAHSGISHLFFNMFAMFVFGHAVEEKMGSVKFLIYYILSGVVAGLFSLIIYWLFSPTGPVIGASGAIYALLFAYAVFFPNRKIYIWGIIPIAPPVLILVYTGIDIYSQLFRATNVAHITHLSGFLFAFFYFRWVYRINPLYIFRNYKNIIK